MAVSSYSELVSAVQDWLMRDDIPVGSLVTLAEAQFNRQLRLRQMVKRSTSTADEAYEGLPGDCLKLQRLTLDGRPLAFVPASRMAELTLAWPSGDTTWFSIVGDQIQLAPRPRGGVLEIVYYARLMPLSEANPTNGLLAWAPDVYLYGCLLQAAPYLRDDARTDIWQSAYSELVRQLNASDDEAEYPAPLSMHVEGMT